MPHQQSATPTATSTAKKLPVPVSLTRVAPLLPELPVPWVNPPDPVEVEPVPAGAGEPPEPAEPEPPEAASGESPREPAPETPGTDSGVAVALAPDDEAEALGSTFGSSPLAKRDFRTTRLSVVAIVLFVPAASVYSYTLLPDTGPALEGGS